MADKTVYFFGVTHAREFSGKVNAMLDRMVKAGKIKRIGIELMESEIPHFERFLPTFVNDQERFKKEARERLIQSIEKRGSEAEKFARLNKRYKEQYLDTNVNALQFFFNVYVACKRHKLDVVPLENRALNQDAISSWLDYLLEIQGIEEAEHQSKRADFRGDVKSVGKYENEIKARRKKIKQHVKEFNEKSYARNIAMAEGAISGRVDAVIVGAGHAPIKRYLRKAGLRVSHVYGRFSGLDLRAQQYFGQLRYERAKGIKHAKPRRILSK